MEINIEQVNNGYIVDTKGTKNNGFVVFKNTEELIMLEYIGRQLSRLVKVEDK
jgi:hypothetical protein